MHSTQYVTTESDYSHAEIPDCHENKDPHLYMESSYKPKQQYANGGNSVTQYKPNDYDTAKLGTLNIKMGYNTIPWKLRRPFHRKYGSSIVFIGGEHVFGS